MNDILATDKIIILNSVLPILDINLDESMVEKNDGLEIPVSLFNTNIYSLNRAKEIFGEIQTLWIPKIVYLKNIQAIRSNRPSVLNPLFLFYMPFIESGQTFLQVIYIEKSIHTSEPSFVVQDERPRNTDNECVRYCYRIDDDPKLIYVDDYKMTRSIFLSESLNNFDLKTGKSRWK